MRQIRVCACFLFALTACSGAEFSAPDLAPQSPYGSAGGSGTTSSSGAASGVPEREAEAGAGTGGQLSSAGAGGTNTKAGNASHDQSGGEAADTSETTHDCPSDTITFRMLPGDKLEPGVLCDAGCGTGWLSITDKEGATGLPISSACGTASCDACEVRQCAAAACLPVPLTERGTELAWDGTYLAKDTCGASKLVCQRRECVKPGRYKARACAALSAGASVAGGCSPQDQRLCAEVEFDFPGAGTVELLLGN